MMFCDLLCSWWFPAIHTQSPFAKTAKFFHGEMVSVVSMASAPSVPSLHPKFYQWV